MAKKLVLTPERYDGKWTIGDARVSGNVDLRGGRRPLGQLIEAPGSLPDSGGMGFPPMGRALKCFAGDWRPTMKSC